ncbi:MAG: hypothetical protein V3V36_00780, partial [Candidatus Hydrothermarchaeaceae archaeon]
KISEEILKETKDCSNGFSCLPSGGKDVCKIEDSIGGAHFIECKNHHGFCNYKQPFGKLCLCECPTRKEIYNEYSI